MTTRKRPRAKVHLWYWTDGTMPTTKDCHQHGPWPRTRIRSNKLQHKKKNQSDCLKNLTGAETAYWKRHARKHEGTANLFRGVILAIKATTESIEGNHDD